MNTNLFLDLGLLVSSFVAIREYSCSFVADILFYIQP